MPPPSEPGRARSQARARACAVAVRRRGRERALGTRRAVRPWLAPRPVADRSEQRAAEPTASARAETPTTPGSASSSPSPGFDVADHPTTCPSADPSIDLPLIWSFLPPEGRGNLPRRVWAGNYRAVAACACAGVVPVRRTRRLCRPRRNGQGQARGDRGAGAHVSRPTETGHESSGQHAQQS